MMTMKINIGDAPEHYHAYIKYLKKYCVQRKIAFLEANELLICRAVAENYGIVDTQEPELLELLQSLKCDDVRENIEDAYDREFPYCYGAYIGFCKPSLHNALCVERTCKRGERDGNN